jgi:hypothetical protein
MKKLTLQNIAKPETHIAHVTTRHWGPDDDYEVIEVQVHDIPARTLVRVTVTPITQEEYDAYLRGETDAAGNKHKPVGDGKCCVPGCPCAGNR